MNTVKLFESKNIRSVWNEADEKWYIVVEDVISILTDSNDPKQYVKRMIHDWRNLTKSMMLTTAARTGVIMDGQILRWLCFPRKKKSGTNCRQHQGMKKIADAQVLMAAILITPT